MSTVYNFFSAKRTVGYGQTTIVIVAPFVSSYDISILSLVLD